MLSQDVVLRFAAKLELPDLLGLLILLLELLDELLVPVSALTTTLVLLDDVDGQDEVHLE